VRAWSSSLAQQPTTSWHRRQREHIAAGRAGPRKARLQKGAAGRGGCRREARDGTSDSPRGGGLPQGLPPAPQRQPSPAPAHTLTCAPAHDLPATHAILRSCTPLLEARALALQSATPRPPSHSRFTQIERLPSSELCPRARRRLVLFALVVLEAPRVVAHELQEGDGALQGPHTMTVASRHSTSPPAPASRSRGSVAVFSALLPFYANRGGGASRWRPGSWSRSAASPLCSTHARLPLAGFLSLANNDRYHQGTPTHASHTAPKSCAHIPYAAPASFPGAAPGPCCPGCHAREQAPARPHPSTLLTAPPPSSPSHAHPAHTSEPSSVTHHQ
jgi:hypothetical protein